MGVGVKLDAGLDRRGTLARVARRRDPPPARATLLAHDPRGPQVFGAGQHLGVQFHPEVTPEILGAWVNSETSESLDAQDVLEQTAREFAAASPAAHRLLSTYIRSLARQAA